jgi:hypothetical protein
MQPGDDELLAHLVSFRVDRFEISDLWAAGDPRSLRFTFDFRPNDFIEDIKLVKELKYRCSRDGGKEGFVSDPVPIKWKSKKKDLTRGLGSHAISLFRAEQVVKLQIDGETVDAISREGLWQNEKVLQGLEELGQERLGFFAWFSYRGLDVSTFSVSQTAEDESVDNESNDGLRDVEIYPDGFELTNALADCLWEDAIGIYGETIFVSATHPEGLTGQIVDAIATPESEPSDETGSRLDDEQSGASHPDCSEDDRARREPISSDRTAVARKNDDSSKSRDCSRSAKKRRI